MKIADRHQLPEDSGLRFKLPVAAGSGPQITGPAEKPAFVFERQGEVYAYENHCPHLGVELDWSPGAFFDSAGQMLICSTHGALFEPETGRCVLGPCEGQSLVPVPLRIEGDELYLAGTDEVSEPRQTSNPI